MENTNDNVNTEVEPVIKERKKLYLKHKKQHKKDIIIN